jgi:ketosteroid isomerase-like protein
MRLPKSMLVVLTLVFAVSAFTISALGKKASADDVAAITQMENASVKADLAGDPTYIEKNYAENYTGGSSWGNWDTKQTILADMKDSKNNKTNSYVTSELNVRVYGDTAVATYTSTYDTMYHGGHRARTILTTDTFARQKGSWQEVASHSSERAK